MTLESWEYGDPETVAARREHEKQRKDRQCGPCVHHQALIVRGQKIDFCERKKQTYGVRCQFFRIRKVEE